MAEDGVRRVDLTVDIIDAIHRLKGVMMGFLYERKETEDRITICFKKAAWFYVLVWPALIVMCLSALLCWQYSPWFGLVVLAIGAWWLVWAISFWRPVAEIKRAMKQGQVPSSGSKYSLSNPLTYTIEKQEAEKSAKKEQSE